MGGLSHTVSGNIASFRTPSRVPIESLKFHFLPKQEGSGDPSPINIRPIEGWTGLNCGCHGINLWDEICEIGRININTGKNDNNVNTTIRSKNYIPCKPGTKYFIKHSMGTNNLCLFCYDKNKNFISYGWKYSIEFTVPDNCYYLRFYLHNSYGTEYHNDVGINYPSSKTSYVKYIGNKEIPITFPDGQTIYGGYIDPVAGEIVAEWKAHTFDGTERIDEYSGSFTGGIRLANNTFDDCTSLGNMTKCDKAILETTTPSDISRLGIRIGEGQYRFYFYVPDSMFDGGATVDKFKTWLSENGMTVVAKLSTPIHIPIPAQDIKAFLDYNNFWSDANDITEVTYAVTESKDILATRKKAMDFDHAHHKKVKWNQIVRDGNFTSRDHWLSSANDYGTVSVNDNIAAWTSTNPELQHYYRTGLTNKQFYLNIPENHRVLVKATVRSSVSRTDSDHRVSIFGMINYENSYSYTQNDVQANTWIDLFGFIRDNRTEGKKITRFKVCYGGTVDDGTIPVGTVLEVKNFMAFDLTQMFGLGNEPSTVKEFEHICEINGIDLTTYQPYDVGSDRWLIVP